jgi:hypothetical protein
MESAESCSPAILQAAFSNGGREVTEDKLLLLQVFR